MDEADDLKVISGTKFHSNLSAVPYLQSITSCPPAPLPGRLRSKNSRSTR